jgi:hypothetical protein
MLDDTGLRVMRLRSQGFCCAQILLLLSLEDLGRDNPDLVRAAQGLCFGLGDFAGPCGALSGAALLLGLYAGKGLADEQANGQLPLMLAELSEWFNASIGAKYGGVSCADITGRDEPGPKPERCGPAVAGAYAKVLEILLASGLDPGQGR